MERQTARPGQSFDVFTRGHPTPRRHYYLDNNTPAGQPVQSKPQAVRLSQLYNGVSGTPPEQTQPVDQSPEQTASEFQPFRQTHSGQNIDGFRRRSRPISDFPQASASNTLNTPASAEAIFNRPSILNATLPPSGTFARSVSQSKPKSKWRTKKRMILSVAGTFAAIVLAFGGWYGSQILGSVDKVFHGNVFSDAHALISGTTLKGQSSGRVNILLAGNSVDDPGHQGAALTDSIMVVSLDLKDHSGFMLSIPRDLWVYIPGQGHQKINAAIMNSNFSEPGFAQGGMGQLEQIIQSDLGIPIDYEALIDYTAFRDAVNAIGGITININSPPYGLYDPYTHLKLPNGQVTLTGQQALDLARSRGDGPGAYGFPNSDFDRTMHQREMLQALASKAKTLGVLTNPLKVTALFNAFGNNVTTDLNLADVIELVKLSGGLNLSNIASYSYSYGGSGSLLSSYVSPSGEDSLAPSAGVDNFSGLKAYYNALVSNNPLAKEQPTVTILNGSKVVGLAGKEKTALQAQGFNVEAIADAATEYPGTMIIDNSNGQKPNSLSELQKLTPGTVAKPTSGSSESNEANGYNTDFTVVLGENWDGTSATN